MVTFLNYNQYFREIIKQNYVSSKTTVLQMYNDTDEFETQAEILSLFFDEIELLHQSKPQLYQYLIQLAFIDYYRIMRFSHPKEDSKKLKMIEEINNFEDLEILLEKNSSFLLDILRSSIEFLDFTLIEKVEFLTIPISNLKRQLAPFHDTELTFYFKDYNINELCSMYEHYLSQHKKDKYAHYEAIELIVNQLKIQFVGNISNFEFLILSMLEPYYVLAKNKQLYHPQMIEKSIQKLIELIEKNELEEIFYKLMSNETLLLDLVTGYFDYHYLLQDFALTPIEDIITTLPIDTKQRIKKKFYFNKV